MFDMREPVYFVRDLNLIKQITVTDFGYFEDKATFIDSSSDSLFGRSILLLKGEKWRNMRAALSPVLTGSKIKTMFKLVAQCADDLIKYSLNETNHDKSIRWEMKQFCSRYTTDVTAAYAFGLKIDSVNDPKNEFFSLVENDFNFGSMQIAIRLHLLRFVPKIMSAMSIELFASKVKTFFKTMVSNAIKVRKESGIRRPDFIDTLMHAGKRNLKINDMETRLAGVNVETVEDIHIEGAQDKSSWTYDEIIAQCFFLFLSGTDTVSNSLTFLAYEIAINQDIQQKMYDEISEINDSLNGAPLSYDTLPKLKYLEQVIWETLRKWPQTTVIKRQCTKDYVCKLNGQEVFLIEKGKTIWIPTDCIHHDPKYFPEPETFDPHRFSDENKHKIPSGSMLSFGIGPRSCIGNINC